MAEEKIVKGEYKVEEVANYFIEKGLETNNPVNPMKLQKLLYFSYGWYIAYFPDKKLFSARVQAWKYGPVIEEIYHDVKSYGNYNITNPITRFAFGETNALGFQIGTPRLNFKIPEDKEFLETIWNSYSKFTAFQLSDMTHAENTPWSELMKETKGNLPKNMVIGDDLMKRYFESYRSKE